MSKARTTQRRPMHSKGAPPRDWRRLIIAGIILLALIIAVLGISSCVRGCKPASSMRNVPQHSYDWSCLKTKGDIKSYTAADGRVAKLGIDVSSHNGEIDWDAVAAQGIDFAYVRVGYRGYTEGYIQDDEYANANMSGAMSSGIDAAVYFFSQAITEQEAIEEADYACDFVDAYGVGDYPVAFDMEENNVADERVMHLSTTEKTAIAMAFCKEVESRGYTPIIYGNDHWLDGEFKLEIIANSYDLWLAQYASRPSPSYRFLIWQYSDSATIDGIEGGCDMNLMFPSLS